MSNVDTFIRFMEDAAPLFERRLDRYVDCGEDRGEALERLLGMHLEIGEVHLIDSNAASLNAARVRLESRFSNRSLCFHHVALGASDCLDRQTGEAFADKSRPVVAAFSSAGDEVDSCRTTFDALMSAFDGRQASLVRAHGPAIAIQMLAGAGHALECGSIDVLYVGTAPESDTAGQAQICEIAETLEACGYKHFQIDAQGVKWLKRAPATTDSELAYMSPNFAAAMPCSSIGDSSFDPQDDRALRAARVHGSSPEASFRSDRVSAQREQPKGTSDVSVELVTLREQLESAQRTIAVRNAALRAEEVLRERSAADLKMLKEEWRRGDAEARARSEAARGREADLTRRSIHQEEAIVRLQAEVERHIENSRLREAELDALRETRDQVVARAGRLEKEAERAIEDGRLMDADRKALQRSLSDETTRSGKLTETLAFAEKTSAAARHARVKAEKRLARLEGVYGEVMASIPQMHRRALAAQSELLQLRLERHVHLASLRMRLWAVLRDRARFPARWAGVPHNLWRELSVSRSNPSAASSIEEPLEAIRFSEGTPELALPLTLKPQQVSLPALASECELHAEVLLPDLDTEVRIEMALDNESSTAFRYLSGDRSAATVPAGGIRSTLRLKANRSRRLLVRRAADREIRIEVRRISGPFCVLKLRLSDGATSPVDSAAGRSLTTRAVGATKKSSLAPFVTGIASRDLQLEEKLWGGYSRYAIAELHQLVADENAPVAERERANWSLCRWNFVEEDYDAALRYVQRARQLNDHRPSTVFGEAQCLARLGRYEEARAILDFALKTLPRSGHDVLLYRGTVDREIGLARGMSIDEAEGLQLAAINDVLQRSHMITLEKRFVDRPLGLENLRSSVSPEASSNQLELVSVVIPAYNAESSIEWVIESLLAQTWRNLEVIVVDDRSTDRTCETVERLIAADKRVRLIRKPSNDGAYPARNIGAREALGEYLTVHDSDDWSHPQKLEMQVAALQAKSNRVASVSHWVRVDERVRILGAWRPRASFFDLNFSSLLFRRKLLEEVGYWDEVLISGDAEFYRRLLLRYGPDSITKISSSCLLALSLTRDDSLTRSKATHLRSLDYGLRWNYRDAFTHWHTSIPPANAALIVATEATPRSFPVPRANRRMQGGASSYDIVVVCDFARDQTVELLSAIGYLKICAQAGKRAAAVHWRRYTERSVSSLAQDFYAVCLDHRVDILSPGDDVYADAVIVADPTVLQYRIDPAPTIRTSRVAVIVAKRSSVDRALHSASTYEPASVRNNAIDIFQQAPIWIGASGAISSFFAREVDPEPLFAADWFPPVDLTAMTAPHVYDGVSPPLIGAVGEDEERCEEFEIELGRLLIADENFRDVCRLRESEVECEPITGRKSSLHSSVRRETIGGTAEAEFDLILYFPDRAHASDHNSHVLRALARGVCVIASREVDALYGTGVLCVDINAIGGTVERFRHDQAFYAERSRAAQTFIEQRVNDGLILERINSLSRVSQRAENATKYAQAGFPGG